MKWKAFWNDSPQVREADSCRQVGRTVRGAAYSERQIEVLVARLLAFLEPGPEKTLLDLACGNGLLTRRLATHFRKVTAVDFSKPLIEVAKSQFGQDNVEYVIGDVIDLDVGSNRYDCVLVSAALQFLNPRQARRLFRQLRIVVTDGGRIVLGDVADRDRIWSFYRGLSGRLRYGVEVIRQRPTIGHWWSPSALRRLAHEEGWTISIHYQNAEHPNHYFRYDAVLERRS
jgi:ubiquinone/menaquinone biosynthesis C-methylase UbiE